uniref:Uncharacterized protein n=1 Tax=Marseillevirus LCMAC201 TaxID=2506605 RepID=A0A481YVD0_9VIRU|nr:MAG: hypothetical protein LCMAC201_01550 [Marseillevirus LCMAC201]
MIKLDTTYHDEPNITLTIPDYLCKDFLGILALDTLHDAKGHGYLVGNKLSQLTDLLAKAILLNNHNLDQYTGVIQNYIFEKVLTYFLELWSNNIGALGLDTIPNGDWESLRDVVCLPLRNVADRADEDAFITLGKNKYGIEAQNYHDQRQKLYPQCAETMSFVSPKGVQKPADYFRQASGIVDIIRARTAGQARVVLDMKASAGLIRTLTDPLGYTTGLPTYADPGYNMPGMSAIRQHAQISFIDEDNQNNYYTGSHEFRYHVQLETPMCSTPLVLLDVTYFYGVAKDGLDRSNMIISMLGNSFNNTLPRSMMMASALGQYLKPTPQQITVTARDTLSIIERIIWNYYNNTCEEISALRDLQQISTQLHKGESFELQSLSHFIKQTPFNPHQTQDLYEWCSSENTIFRSSYIVATFRNLYLFDVSSYLPVRQLDCLLPEEMIINTLPKLMFEYLSNGKNFILLSFCYHQLKLIEQFIGKPNSGLVYHQDLAEQLTKTWIPKRKGKLLIQISKHVQEWRKNQALTITIQKEILIYIKNLLSVCNQQLGILVDLDTREPDDPRIEILLKALPLFQPSAVLEDALSEHLHFYDPEMYYRTAKIRRTGLLLGSLLNMILWKKPLVTLDLDLQAILVITLHPSAAEYRNDHYTDDALRSVFGKFSGDFGQIMWSICYGHLFASEDNNTSAMALMLHRIPKQYINTYEHQHGGWGNIHGLGDGSCVDVTLNKEH